MLLTRRGICAAALAMVSTAVRAQSIQISHVVTPVKQPSRMSCWAAAATMIYNWHVGFDQGIEAVVALAGPKFTKIYEDSFASPPSGISSTDEAEFYHKIGLIYRPGINPSIAGWAQILKDKGPLSVTVDAEPGKGYIHALTIVGLDGDGSAKGTIISYIDPADGLKHDVWFTDFLKLYEGSATWPLQIIHNP